MYRQLQNTSTHVQGEQKGDEETTHLQKSRKKVEKEVRVNVQRITNVDKDVTQLLFVSLLHISGEHYTFTDGIVVTKENIDSIRDATAEHLRSIYPENIVEKIIRIKTCREEELKARQYMTSLPQMTNSYGRFEFFKMQVHKKYDKMLANILHDNSVNDSSTD